MKLDTGKTDLICPICGTADVRIEVGKGDIVKDFTPVAEYEVRTCTCHKCGAPVYSSKVELFNRIAEAEALRKAFPDRFISLKDIRALPRRYNISREGFRIVMGIPTMHLVGGEDEPFKLFDGELPSDELEDKLQAVNKSPSVWMSFLKEAKSKLPKEEYEKSMKAAKG